MKRLLQGIRAAAEMTRLRLLALCANGELTVSELMQILGQSQPRISRHLKLLVDAGLLERFREGTWAFYRLAETGDGAALARQLIALMPKDDDALRRDLARLEGVREARALEASAFFRRNADQWDEIRSLYIDDGEVERELLSLLPDDEALELLDVGTGTGRILEVLGARLSRAVGIDVSHEMLSIARVNLNRAGLGHCHVRYGDMHRIPLEDASRDMVTFHLALHYAERPAAALLEAVRVMRPGGMLIVVDFATHSVESLRREHAHRWLGFGASEMKRWFEKAALRPGQTHTLAGRPLTVEIWTAHKPESAEVAGIPAERDTIDRAGA